MANVTGTGLEEEDEPGTEDAEASGKRAWPTEPWYRSWVGIGLVGFDVVLTIVLVAVTTNGFEEFFIDPATTPVGVIPWYIYVFAVLGALGYVFTTLTVDFDRDASAVFQSNFRLPAALPLGAGVFLCADVILGDAADTEVIVIGLVFLSGLYVNLAYRQLGALAERLLPGGKGRKDAEQSSDGSSQPSA